MQQQPHALPFFTGKRPGYWIIHKMFFRVFFYRNRSLKWRQTRPTRRDIVRACKRETGATSASSTRRRPDSPPDSDGRLKTARTTLHKSIRKKRPFLQGKVLFYSEKSFSTVKSPFLQWKVLSFREEALFYSEKSFSTGKRPFSTVKSPFLHGRGPFLQWKGS